MKLLKLHGNKNGTLEMIYNMASFLWEFLYFPDAGAHRKINQIAISPTDMKSRKKGRGERAVLSECARAYEPVISTATYT